MSFLEYVKDKTVNIIIYVFSILLITALLRAFKTLDYVCIILAIILLINGISMLLINYYRKKSFHSLFSENLKRLDQKYLILETIPEANTYEEKIFVDYLYDINKSMIERINKNKLNITNFKEFIEIWIHEVKIPISSLVLKCHNNQDKYDKSFLAIIRKLDNSIDEILYYVRSEYTDKDFSISETNLKEIVRNISIRNKDDLLENKIALDVNLNDFKVSTDKKWLEFILNQIINNSIKYKKDSNSIIKIDSFEKDDKIILEIFDNGIGIPKKDLKRVFEKSFTGLNGRNRAKSTGMGLYITKKLCDKLGHNLKIESIENEYTKVIIEFGKNSLYKF